MTTDLDRAEWLDVALDLLQALESLLGAYRLAVKLYDPNTDDALTVIAHNAIAKTKACARMRDGKHMPTQADIDRFLHKKLAEIARQHLRIETLDTCGSDRLDFHDVSVWGVKAALQAAYNLGRKGSPTAKGGAE